MSKKTPYAKMRSIMAKLDNELAKEAKESKEAKNSNKKKETYGSKKATSYGE